MILWDALAENGVERSGIVEAWLELYVPHPGMETQQRAREQFEQELDAALSDANVCVLVYAGVLLERAGAGGELPSITKEQYDADLTFIVADEVLGIAIATYVGGTKGLFEYVRFDKKKPGVLSSLPPFLDDVVAGLIGGVSANTYTQSSRGC